MIIGVTGDYDRGKKEIIKTLIKQGFSYEPLPRRFMEYSYDAKINYFNQLIRKGNLVLDEFANLKEIKEFNSMKDFYLFGAHMPAPIKFYYESIKKVNKKEKNWEYYNTFFNKNKEKTKEVAECLSHANKVFNYNSNKKSLEGEILEAYKELL